MTLVNKRVRAQIEGGGTLRVGVSRVARERMDDKGKRRGALLYLPTPKGVGNRFDPVYDLYDQRWVGTVVNPSEKSGGSIGYVLAVAHLVLWVVGLVLTSIAGFGAKSFFEYHTTVSRSSPSSPPSPGSATVSTGAIKDWDFSKDYATDTVVQIGMIGSSSTILGVVLLLFTAALIPARPAQDTDNMGSYKNAILFNTLINFFTLYGTICALFILMKAAFNTETTIFWLSVVGVSFQGCAQVLLYCTSDALDVTALPRIFIPCLAASFQLVTAMCVNTDDFKCAGHFITAPATGSATLYQIQDCENNQKVVAWLAPIFTLTGIAVLLAVRKYFEIEMNVSLAEFDIKQMPFARAAILVPFVVATVFSLVVFSFLQPQGDEIAYLFGLASMLLQFTMVGVLFTSGK